MHQSAELLDPPLVNKKLCLRFCRNYISQSEPVAAPTSFEDKVNQIQPESRTPASSAKHDHQITVVNKQQQAIQLNQAKSFTALSPVFQIQNCTVNIYY